MFSLANSFISHLRIISSPLRDPGESSDFQVVEGADGTQVRTPMFSADSRVCGAKSERRIQQVYFLPKKERFTEAGGAGGLWDLGRRGGMQLGGEGSVAGPAMPQGEHDEIFFSKSHFKKQKIMP